jgi:dihydroxyacetone kinase-like predicted kinase
VHVHTFNPDRVLGYCLRYGDFLTMKIENMSVQHTELDAPTAEEQGSTPKKESAFSFSGGFSAPKTVEEDREIPAERKPFGIVAVSNGEGISALFKDLGVDEIVHGGQTQNPSTNDFLAAFEKVNAEHLFVFPNNGNILMAAKQAAELYEAATVHVIPSKSIGAGYVALSSFPYGEENADDIAMGLQVAMRRATAGYVSPAVRNADINGVQITEGDTIGVIEKEIVLSVKDRLEAAKDLAAKLLEMPEKFMLTVFRGADGTDAECHALEAFCNENYPSAEVYFIDGGQEVYPFVFVAE